jgi:hypothetical protein
VGLFSNSKVNETEALINLIQLRFGEYIAIQEKNPHPVHSSVSKMLGDLYDNLFKLYYPNKQVLDNQMITVQANRLPISFFITATFKTGLAFEEDMECKIFKDDAQRAFARSVSHF